MQKDLNQLKTVVITGGGSGIGFETAFKLLKAGGFRVALLGKSAEKLDEAKKDLKKRLDRTSVDDLVTCFECDLSDSVAVRKTIDKIATTHRSIYGLVNNAGVYPFGGLHTTTETDWDEVFSINLKSAFLLIQGLVPLMAKNRVGRVVNVSSTAGILPNHFALAYSVSKAALIQLTRTLAKELGKDSITVNCVCPGIVKTPLHEGYHRNRTELDQFYAKRGAAFPLGRVGEPEDIASVIEFFLSEGASWVTGDVFIADGGRLLT